MSKINASQKISTSSKKTTRRRPVILASIAAVVVVSGGILLWSIFEKEDSNLVVTPDNVEEVIANASEKDKVPVGSFEVNMNTTWTFPNSRAASTDAYIANSVNNSNTVFFTISLPNSSEVIYTSPYIPVGSRMENITLNCDWDPGTYDVVLTYHLVDSAYVEMSRVSVSLEIVIEN